MANTPVMMYNYNVVNHRKWHVVYYEDSKGTSQAYDFIQKSKPREKVKAMAWLEQLETQGPNLPRPYADLLRNGIHELRIKLSGKQVRILYFFCFRDFIVLTNVFTKKTSKVPEKEIQTALIRREDFLKRYDEQKIRSITK